MRSKISLLFIALSFLFGDQIQNVGTSALVFLKMDLSARSSGMGGAFSAVANDPSAMFFNPAGLVQIKRPSMSFSHVNWIFDTKLNMVAGVLPTGNYGTIGFAISSFNSGDIDETTIYHPEGTGRSFSVNDYLMLVSFSRELTDRLNIGINGKFVREKILHEEARAFAFDFGSLFTTGFLDTKLALVLSNFGTSVKFQGRDLLVEMDQGREAYLKTYSWNLPLLFRVGLAGKFNLYSVSGLWSLEMVDSRDAPPRFNLGTELNLLKYFVLRTGYRYGYDSGGLTFGMGISVSPKGFKTLAVDYSYSELQRLGKGERLSLNFEF